jgi:hypothetical protein
MSDRELIDAVAHVTGEDSREIRRRGIKQHLFCKSRSSEVGHLASMVR